MTLGQRISHYRKKARLSQEELGARLNVSRQAVSKWENDLAAPDMTNLLGLAREFDVSVAELTETPESAPAQGEPSMPKAKAPSPPPRWRSRVVLVAATVVCIGLLLVVPYAFFTIRGIGTNPAPDTTDEHPAQEALGDFTLILDWAEAGEFLELGEQDSNYPFGTSLYLSGGETVVKGDNGEEIYTVGSLDENAFRLRYNRIEDDSLPARNVITMLEVILTKEVSTPRDIRVGSTKADVVAAYGPDSLVYCLKEDGDPLCRHDYYYAYQEYSDNICFFMKDGLVAGIRVENMMDLGNEAYAVNNITRFPVLKNGDPDYSDRQDLEQEPLDATRRVYIAWNRLVTGENLSAEERYTDRGQVFSGLPDMDWQEFGSLGTTDDLATSEAFTQWLREQTFSDSELFWVQAGHCAKGLDGVYSENYDSLLAAALFQNPVGYAKHLPRAAEYSERVRESILRSTAYGADYYTAECASAVEALDAVIGTNALTAAENDWAELLRYYLANPNSGNYADYPNTLSARAE